MKKLVLVLLATLTVIGTFTTSAQASTPKTRTMDGKILRVYATDNKYINECEIRTKDGHYWICFIDTDSNLTASSKVTVKFRTNGTKTKIDDEIKKVSHRKPKHHVSETIISPIRK